MQQESLNPFNMQPPESATVFETSTSKYWFHDGVLYAITRKAPQVSLEETIRQTEEFKKQLGGKKICGIMDVTDASPSSRETRDYSSKELPKMFKAIAFITTSAVGRMLAHLYLGFKPMSFPIKVFANEEDAKKWIKQYLD